ncbi:MAG: SMP-30/gluconolactonase/LRE family protein [Sandaracinaceae bacterium]|nr:SMP-30/gluconolactonase/LRE family protein [Sandaracinaceae bacterium]
MRSEITLLLLLSACGGSPSPDGGQAATDAAAMDAAPIDAAPIDAARIDAPIDAAPIDARSGADAFVPPSGACPAGSAELVLDLSGVALEPVAGLPIRDGALNGWGIVEGPVWIGDALYVSHFGGGPTPRSRIYRVEGASVSVARDDSGTNGLALGPDGRLYGADHARGAIVSYDVAQLDQAPRIHAAEHDGARFDSPNDLVLRADGAIYFTDPDYQAPSSRPQRATRVYRVDPAGAIEVIDGITDQPNGITLSLDELTLYVGSASGLRRYALDAEGRVTSGPTAVAAISGGVDGLGRDCAGNLYVTNSGRVVILDRDERRVGSLSAPGATNVAFGGSDRRTLYVTSLGDPPALRSAALNVPGLPY